MICIFCGAEVKVVSIPHPNLGMRAAVVCNKCGAQGPYADADISSCSDTQEAYVDCLRRAEKLYDIKIELRIK